MAKRRRPNAVDSRFLRPEQIEAAIDEVAALAADENVQVALAGGVTMQLYGSDRFTADVDFVADQRLEGLAVENELTFGGVATRTSDETPVDLIVRDDAYRSLYEAALEGARSVRGIPMPVVTREYMAALKLAAHRGKDLDDLEYLVLHTRLDVPRTRQVIAEHLGEFAAREFDAFVAETKWLATQGGDGRRSR